MLKLLSIVIMMGLVTYLPRLLPVVILNNLRLPPFLKSFLQYIPYAALGALIFPGVLYSTGDIRSALAGCTVSVVLAFYRLNIILVVVGGIAGVYLYELLF
ncbi:MAG TPA: AzlD domain-containing protein [Syntrophomonadaceae bacterium]|nr:AzlD domain-containing protein [Syntrophomonadaceae bacterium]